jgi:thiol:disulfide interchange protein
MKAIRIGIWMALWMGMMAVANAQDTTRLVKWQVSSKKSGNGNYELIFSGVPNSGWQLYAPDQVLSEVELVSLHFSDSAIAKAGLYATDVAPVSRPSMIFEGNQEKIFTSATKWTVPISIQGDVPASIQGSLLYTVSRADEFYQQEFPFTVTLEGGVSATTRMLIPAINVKSPVNNCGDDDTEDKSLFRIFLLGFVGGLIALITPCVFPLIPLTVSFFTKRSGTRRKGIRNAFFYGLCIFGIYALLSLPFHLLDKTNPEIFNNISTNVTLNITFFVVFIVFALSFFGLYEIGLPSSFANKVDSKSGIGDFAGIFFMALTLAIVSFSCTGPILGSLLAGALSNNGGAIQLTAGMSGFGLGLALPFALFALFPHWLQSIPKSGGWLNSVKVVLGFLELAMAVKFLSNADLVKQWGILKREVFIGIWIVIGVAIVLYLLGVIKFSHDSKTKMTRARGAFVLLFSVLTLYLVPGVFNSSWANLKLISGFPPPLSYSVYEHPVSLNNSIQPIHNDFEKALAMARAQNKPLLIDFTGWACVNCRKMEESIWTDPEVAALMREKFVVVSLYVDERKKLPAASQLVYTTKKGDEKPILTVGDKWATFQAENFYAVAQPQYAIISPSEKALTRTKGYSPSASSFRDWLECGLEAMGKQ